MKILISRPGLGFLLLVFSLNVVSANTLALWQSKEYIKKAFFEIAYKNEYRKGSGKLNRWGKGIDYEVEYFQLPSAIAMAEYLISEHFKDLSDITALPIVRSNKNPNFKIILTRQTHYKQAIEKYTTTKIKNIDMESNCLVSVKHLRHQLIRATVIIPIDEAMRYGFLPACVVEELTQAMGLPNDSDWVNPSIANDKSTYDLLTGLDYLMLKILYDKRLMIGMNVEQSDRVVDTILLDFEQQNLIRDSISKARKLNIPRQLK